MLTTVRNGNVWLAGLDHKTTGPKRRRVNRTQLRPAQDYTLATAKSMGPSIEVDRFPVSHRPSPV